MTKSEQEAYTQGLYDGEQKAVSKPGYKTSEFYVVATTTAFSMWVGAMMVLNPEIELQRGGAIIAAVLAAAWQYTKIRTEAKKNGN